MASAHSEFDMWLMLDQDDLILFPFLREEPRSMSLYLVLHSCFVYSWVFFN